MTNSKTNDPVLEVKMHLPKSVLERFRAKAKQLIPEEGDGADSLLLTMFIEFMSSDYWCILLPDLSKEDRKWWQEIADKIYDSLYEVVRIQGTAAFPKDLGELVQAVISRRKMEAEDLIKMIVISGKHGQISWNKSNPGFNVPS